MGRNLPNQRSACLLSCAPFCTVFDPKLHFSEIYNHVLCISCEIFTSSTDFSMARAGDPPSRP